MRTILFLVLSLAACEKTPLDQCMEGATSVDGVPCCSAVTPRSSCSPSGQICIDDTTHLCQCENGAWKCDNEFIIPDMTIPDLSPRD
jgi:hypothetical protein